ncbi:hypothetical protein [Paractinoplanes abujensis]
MIAFRNDFEGAYAAEPGAVPVDVVLCRVGDDIVTVPCSTPRWSPP